MRIRIDQARRGVERIVEILFPFPCLACDTLLPFPTPELALCRRCRAGVREPRGRCCRTCGVQLPATPGRRELLSCGRCLVRPPAFYALYWGAVYAPPVVSVVHALKYQGRAFLGEDFADLLWRRHGHALSESVDLVVPVPLAWTRRLARGFNQAEAIARPLARRLGRPLARPLTRRPRPPQVGRSGLRRRRNLRGTFRVHGRAALGRRVLLVDDVVTTGATLDEAARTLQDNGAEAVVAVTAVRTPGRHERFVHQVFDSPGHSR